MDPAGQVSLHSLLKSLDGVNEISSAVIVATTNYANELSEALVNRPGRFDRVWEFPKPDRESIVKFLKLHKLQCKDMTVRDVAARLAGLNLAFAEELVKSLRMKYRRTEFTKDEVVAVLDRIQKHEKLMSSKFDKPIKGFGTS